MGVFRYTTRTFSRELLVILIAALWWVPFYLLVLVAVMPSSQVETNPFGLPSHVVFGNFASAWGGMGQSSLGAALISSTIITVGSVLCLIAVGSACAYAVGRREGRMGTGLYLVFLIGLVFPSQLGIIPTFVALRSLGLSGTYLGMILLYTGTQMPFAVFFYTGFVRQLPRDYEDAAYIDGASRIRTFVRVVFPLLKPVTGTVAVLATVFIWNDFFTQLIFFAGSPKQTIPVKIYSFVGEYVSQWNLIFAAVIITIAPVLIFYLVAQRQLIRGFSGGIKT